MKSKVTTFLSTLVPFFSKVLTVLSAVIPFLLGLAVHHALVTPADNGAMQSLLICCGAALAMATSVACGMLIQSDRHTLAMRLFLVGLAAFIGLLV